MAININSVEQLHTVAGRFAPSPTGLLHFGSLVTAVASYCFAKAQGGKWLLRMEDLDIPRNVPGAADAILRQLEHLGLFWDGCVTYQSSRVEFYADTLQHLINTKRVYRCTCTRREVAAEAQQHSNLGPLYSGRCRELGHDGEKRGSWRLRVTPEPIQFTDLLRGEVLQCLSQSVGDFILKRTDNIFAYQFATPLDDAAQQITQVVRGADLVDSTPRQIYLMRLLNEKIPAYAHIPLVLDRVGNKISKSSQALRIIDSSHPLPFDTSDLFSALKCLGQDPPAGLLHCPAVELITWAVYNFKAQHIQRNNFYINT